MGEVVDYYICVKANIFVGNGDLFSFSFLVMLERMHPLEVIYSLFLIFIFIYFVLFLFYFLFFLFFFFFFLYIRIQRKKNVLWSSTTE